MAGSVTYNQSKTVWNCPSRSGCLFSWLSRENKQFIYFHQAKIRSFSSDLDFFPKTAYCTFNMCVTVSLTPSDMWFLFSLLFLRRKTHPPVFQRSRPALGLGVDLWPLCLHCPPTRSHCVWPAPGRPWQPRCFSSLADSRWPLSCTLLPRGTHTHTHTHTLSPHD